MRPFVGRFLATEAAGGVVLVVAAAVALVWANLAPGSYTDLAHELHALVNDGLMAIFFLVVGLEIKRELVTGDLRAPRVAALPAVAAVGGMVVPALVYLAFNAGGPGADGWGIPMATDIAFAVGVVALLGARVAPSLKLFLLSLAVVDDIGAIVVIAVFYTDDLDVRALVVAGLLVLVSAALRAAGVHAIVVHVALGVACWFALDASGVHPTLAGVAFGLLTPATRAESIESRLHPWSSFVIVPLFALVNAGIQIRTGVLDVDGAKAVAAGVLVGLVVGKLVGVFGAAWLAVRLRVATLPADATWPAIAGIAAIAGIGFTVSLFVTGLAFDDPALTDAAGLAVLAASVVAAALGAAVLTRLRPAAPPPPPAPPAG
jgi:NhaA family Na+:H+ antiporter